jgi:hypothetical protein
MLAPGWKKLGWKKLEWDVAVVDDREKCGGESERRERLLIGP